MGEQPTGVRVKAIDRRRTLKLIHTSDIHLGCDFSGEIARRALVAVVDAALSSRADALLIAGDFFDHNRVADGEVEFLLEQLAHFAKPSIILSGNHDCYDAGSVYRRETFRRRPGSVHLVDGLPEHSGMMPELDLELWGRPVVDHRREFRPLGGMPPRRNDHWRVALAHGHFELPGDAEPRSSPIFPEDIASSTCDYVALGHWDRCADVSQGGVPAFYSGAPH